MDLPPALTAALGRGRLLLLWAALPFPLEERRPNRPCCFPVGQRRRRNCRRRKRCPTSPRCPSSARMRATG